MIPIVIAALALAGATIGLAVARRTEAATVAATAGRHRLQKQQQRIQENPADFIVVEGARHNVGRQELQGHLGDANAKLAVATKRLQDHPIPDWTGDAYRLRILVAAGFVVVWVVGMVLNIGIFAALLGSTPMAMIFAVAFGMLASVIELAIAAVLALQFSDRKPGSGAWQAKTWGALAVLAAVLFLVWQYAPARSEAAIGPVIAQQELAVAQEKSGIDGREPDPLVVQAAQTKLDAERERLRQAQAADQFWAVLLPVLEVLAFDFALQGYGAVRLEVRRRRLQEDVEMAKRQAADLDRRIRVADASALYDTYEGLRTAGVRDIGPRVANHNRQAQDGAVSGSSQGPPRTPRADIANAVPTPRPAEDDLQTNPPGGETTGIDLGRLHEASNAPKNEPAPDQPDAGWDLSR
jgi:hypothetical protein